MLIVFRFNNDSCAVTLPNTLIRLPLIICFFRGSLPEVFCEKGVLRNFAKFIGKHLCQSLFFNKVEFDLDLVNSILT